MSPSAAKRQKRPKEAPLWTFKLLDSAALKSVVEAIQAVEPRVTFRVCTPRGSDKYMLMFDGADPGSSCWVSAKLQLDEVVVSSAAADDAAADADEDEDFEHFRFCVECKHLLITLESPSCMHGSLLVEGYSDATIHLKMHDPDQSAHAENARINTYVDGVDPKLLKSMDYSYSLEIDVSKLREMLKKAKKVYSEHLRVQIFLRDAGPKQLSQVVFSVNGDL